MNQCWIFLTLCLLHFTEIHVIAEGNRSYANTIEVASLITQIRQLIKQTKQSEQLMRDILTLAEELQINSPTYQLPNQYSVPSHSLPHGTGRRTLGGRATRFRLGREYRDVDHNPIRGKFVSNLKYGVFSGSIGSPPPPPPPRPLPPPPGPHPRQFAFPRHGPAFQGFNPYYGDQYFGHRYYGDPLYGPRHLPGPGSIHNPYYGQTPSHVHVIDNRDKPALHTVGHHDRGKNIFVNVRSNNPNDKHAAKINTNRMNEGWQSSGYYGYFDPYSRQSHNYDYDSDDLYNPLTFYTPLSDFPSPYRRTDRKKSEPPK